LSSWLDGVVVALMPVAANSAIRPAMHTPLWNGPGRLRSCRPRNSSKSSHTYRLFSALQHAIAAMAPVRRVAPARATP
jgi:hypothetical protein